MTVGRGRPGPGPTGDFEGAAATVLAGSACRNTGAQRSPPTRPGRVLATADKAPSLCSGPLGQDCRFLPDAPTIELHTASLSFSVSRDEEYVHLRVLQGRLTLDLGARAHHYMLLTLARRRLADAAEGCSDDACGWVSLEDVAHNPSMAPPRLNVHVWRLRKQLASGGVANAARIVERRGSTRQLRVGTGRIAIAVL